MKLEEIKYLLIELAKQNGLSETDLHADWAIDYRENLDQEMQQELAWLVESMRLYRDAQKNNDMLAARSGILRASVRAAILRDFFDAISSDLQRAALHFNWPDFPEDYKIPSQYNYRGPK